MILIWIFFFLFGLSAICTIVGWIGLFKVGNDFWVNFTYISCLTMLVSVLFIELGLGLGISV